MKKFLVLTMCLIFLTLGANAFALVANDQTYSYSNHTNLNQGAGNSSASFTFSNVIHNFIASETTLYPSLSLIQSGNSDKESSDVLKFGVGNQYPNLATITTENPTYSFNATTLGYLNNAITNGSVTFLLVRNSRTSSLSAARLTGSVAPQPALLALVCAGLVALPFARRLRKTIRAQF